MGQNGGMWILLNTLFDVVLELRVQQLLQIESWSERRSIVHRM